MIKQLFITALLCASFYAQATENNQYGFIENKGQIAEKNGTLHSEIDYKLEVPGVNAYFNPDGIIYHFYKSFEKAKSEYTPADNENYKKGDLSAIGKKVFFFRLDFNLLNANKHADKSSAIMQEQMYNYYLAHCPKGITGVHSYEKITYSNIYPNIDINYFFKNNTLKYEFVVRPGGDINQIKFLYNGAQSTTIVDGNLIVKNDYNTIHEEKPYTYYNDDKSEINSSFKINDNVVSFDINNYDHTKTIVIDPIITWSSYYSNAYSSDFHCNSAFDSNGNIFTTYATYGSTWPTINAGSGQYFDGTKDGITDLVVAKINSNYSKQWTTYYGGDGGDYLCGTGGDYGKTIGVDASNNIYFGGYTNGATIFPTLASGTGGSFYQDQTKLYGGDNSFLVKLDNNGVRQWATLFQHEQANTNSAGMRINGICVKGTKVYFTGETYKFNSNNIPLRVLAGAYNNSTFVGDQDPFIGRFDNNCILEWSTYLNGGVTTQKAYKQGVDLTIDASGNLIYVGQTSGANPLSTYLLNPGGGAYFSNVFAGSYDVQIAKFNTSMASVWSTIYGSSDLDRVSEVATDVTGNILIACRTIGGTGLPTVNPGSAFYYSTKQSPGTWSSPGSQDGGIMKFTSAGSLYWATYVGGNDNNTTSITGITSDNSGNIYAIGYTNTTNFPTLNLSGSYYQAANAGSQDLVLMKFNSSGTGLWSTYYGGTGSDSNYGTKINTSSSSTGCGYKQFTSFATASTNIPTTNPGGSAFFEATNATANSNAVLLIEEPNAAGNSVAASNINGSSTICSGNSATLTVNGGSLGTAANWQWYSGSCGGTAAGSGASIVVSPSSNTSYYVRGEGTCNTTTCVTINVSVSATPTIAIGSISSNIICSGQSVTITPTGGTASNYTLMPSGATGSSFVVSPTSTITYTISGSSASGCLSTASSNLITSITVNTTPTISTSGASSGTICSGQSFNITPLAGSGTGSYTLVNTGATSTTNFNVSPTTSTTYTIIGANSNGCISTASSDLDITITVNATPTISTSGASSGTICSGQSFNITPLAGSGTGSYTLVNTGATSTTNFNVSPTSSTTYTIIGANISGCISTASSDLDITITVNATPTISTSGASSGTICSGQSFNITPLAGSGTGSYTLVNTGATSTTNFNVSPTSSSTYTIIGANSSGCISTASSDLDITITVNATPTISTSGASSGTICSGQSFNITPLAGSGTGSYTLVNTGATSTTNFNVSPTTTTTYSIIGANSNGCMSTTSSDLNITITVNATPTISTSGASSGTICSGQSFNITPLAGSGTGSYTLVNTGATSTTNFNVSPTSTSTYSIIGANSSGCISTASSDLDITITVITSPTVNALFSSNALCSSQNVTITLSGADGIYTLSPGSLTASAPSGSFVITPPSGTTIYTVTANNSNGCISTLSSQVYTTSVSVVTNPTITASFITNTICTGSTATITPFGANSYTLLPDNITVLSGSSFTLNPNTTSTYTINGTATGGCVSINSTQFVTTIGVNTTPTISLSSIDPSASICSGQSATLTVSGAVAGSYTIVNTGSSANPLVVSPLTSTTYTVIGMAANGCISAGSTDLQTTITVNQSPSLTVTSQQDVLCFGTSTGSLNITPSGGTGTTTLTPTNTINLSAGNYTYMVTDALGCSSQSVIAINQPTSSVSILSASETASNSNCVTFDGSASVSTTGGTGSLSVTWNGGAQTGTLVTGLNTGINTFTITDTNGCTNTSGTGTINISGVSGIALAVSSQNSVSCMGLLNGAITFTTTGLGPNSYSLTNVTTTTILSNTTGTFTGLSAGTYSVLVSGNGGCVDTQMITISEPTSSISLSGGSITSNSINCYGGNAVVTATATGGSGSYTYVWGSNSSTSNSATYSAGTYTMTVLDGNNCSLSNVQSFTLTQPTSSLNVTSISNTTLACNGGTTTVNVTATGGTGTYTYQWQSNPSTTNNAIYTQGTYTMVVMDANGCLSSAQTFTVTQPTNSLTVNQVSIGTTCPNQNTGSVELVATGGSPTYSIVWNNNSTNFTQSNLPAGPITATVTDMNGCEAFYQSDIVIASCVTVNIPTFFTPNSDGKNDLFMIDGLSEYPNNKIEFYNRWGNLIYSKAPYDNSFAGKANAPTIGNGLLPAGTYYIVFDFGDGKTPVYKGYFELKY